MRRIISGLAVLALLVVAGCGSSSSGASTASSSATSSAKSNIPGSSKHLKVTWLYTGPAGDGGFNTSQEIIMHNMGKLPGVTVSGIYNIPYDQQASQIVRQAIANGSNVIVDTLGLASLLTTVCQQAPQVSCFDSTDPAPQPSNTRSYWIHDWDLGYLAGMAAGLMTKTGTIGFIGAFKVPLIDQAVNTYALGCQAVKPNCRVRAVFLNSYFDPTAATQAAQTLIGSGVDVLRNWVDDPSFCQIAQKRGVYAVGEFLDFHTTCPKSIITSTIWDFSKYFASRVKEIQAGQFKGSGSSPDLVPVSGVPGAPRLGAWGSFVPKAVQDKVEAVSKEIISGKKVITGPIRDQSGKVRFASGQIVPDLFMLSKWNWLVQGVIASK